MNLICRFICIVYINVKSYGASYFQLRSSLNLDDRVHKANIFFLRFTSPRFTSPRLIMKVSEKISFDFSENGHQFHKT